MYLRRLTAISLTLWAMGAASASAIALHPIGSFDQPVFITSDQGNPERLFVVEREGAIRLVEDGSVSTFADLSPVVRCCDGERGLLSMATAPDFATTGRFYVDYTDNDGNIRVDELTATGDVADPLSRRSVLNIPHLESASHNGGQLQFGPDGYLYISTGDGGGSNGEFHHAQNLNSPLGKILRIDPDQSGLDPYSVPPDNPFVGGSTQDDAIWSLGLRNPFRFSFDRLTGGMAIGDVGQDAREEIDWAPSVAPGTAGGGGANYGWNCREGLLAGPGTDPECSTLALSHFTDPVFEYPHEPVGRGAFGCSIIGGYVVRDPDLGSLNGRYVYTDFCTGDIRSLQLPATSGQPAVGDCSLGVHVDKPTSFGEDSAGRLYVASASGGVYRLGGLPSAGCPPPSPREPSGLRPLPNVGIKAERRRVKRGKPALIVAWISPCEGHKGQQIRLLRGGRSNGSRFLSRACTARFHPRVRRRTVFRATLLPEGESSDFLFAESRRLTIKIDHRRRR